MSPPFFFFFLFFTDLLPATDGDTKTMTFLQEVVDILLAYIVESFDRETKVIDFHYPNELLQMNNWELQDEPATLDDILISCRATLKYAIKTGRPASGCRTPRLINHLLISHFPHVNKAWPVWRIFPAFKAPRRP